MPPDPHRSLARRSTTSLLLDRLLTHIEGTGASWFATLLPLSDLQIDALSVEPHVWMGLAISDRRGRRLLVGLRVKPVLVDLSAELAVVLDVGPYEPEGLAIRGDPFGCHCQGQYLGVV